MAMLGTIDINRFRGIRDLSIGNLGPVNLVVGDNNCGKTSVLEAIQLLHRTVICGSPNYVRPKKPTPTFQAQWRSIKVGF